MKTCKRCPFPGCEVQFIISYTRNFVDFCDVFVFIWFVKVANELAFVFHNASSLCDLQFQDGEHSLSNKFASASRSFTSRVLDAVVTRLMVVKWKWVNCRFHWPLTLYIGRVGTNKQLFVIVVWSGFSVSVCTISVILKLRGDRASVPKSRCELWSIPGVHASARKARNCDNWLK